MQRLFARQMKPLVIQQNLFDCPDGAASGRFADPKAAGDVELATILAPVTQSQKHLVCHTQLARTAKIPPRLSYNLNH